MPARSASAVSTIPNAFERVACVLRMSRGTSSRKDLSVRQEAGWGLSAKKPGSARKAAQQASYRAVASCFFWCFNSRSMSPDTSSPSQVCRTQSVPTMNPRPSASVTWHDRPDGPVAEGAVARLAPECHEAEGRKTQAFALERVRVLSHGCLRIDRGHNKESHHEFTQRPVHEG